MFNPKLDRDFGNQKFDRNELKDWSKTRFCCAKDSQYNRGYNKQISLKIQRLIHGLRVPLKTTV